MKGLLDEQAVIVGCDVDGCAKLLIFNRGIDRQDLDEAILCNGWLPLPQPLGDEPFQQEHACFDHAAIIEEQRAAAAVIREEQLTLAAALAATIYDAWDDDFEVKP